MNDNPKTDIKSSSSAHKNISLVRLIELRRKNLSFPEIAKLVGTSHQNVQERLAPFLEAIENLPAIKTHRADLFTVYGHGILSTLHADDIEKASAYQRVGMAGLLHNMERLERGQSTENVAYADLTRGLDQLRAQRRELEAQLSMADDSEVVDV